MKKTVNIIWIIALIAVVVLIGVVCFGYYKKATLNIQNPLVTMEIEIVSRPSTRSGSKLYYIS